ncbi:solute carrier organic anion transporter family member 1C1-like isoform X2 [Acipenser ruthenus]|uniref:solute carrier organic anion transporter family member 1C1-like isoform X2 n=1 Tax=Acipenser ruthenus TaxID=7906 RepID=UPI002742504B|nr:solute carrier organic anion transporter family member 1C1-like isoform X2 [Acipenser ruthenus]
MGSNVGKPAGQQTEVDKPCIRECKKTGQTCCSQLKMFLVALSFAYFAKALSGTYMKSSITQIERRFDLPSSYTGLIDGGFEMGNLLFLAVVSHFGVKFHRPKLIGAGCLLMCLGSCLTGMPHFFMGRYKYETVIRTSVNVTRNTSPCLPYQNQSGGAVVPGRPSEGLNAGCEKEAGSYMWVYVFLGNALRGIGETPVMPLGISYIDDFAKAENSAFYIESVTITPRDARWVGAWWLGFLVSAVIMLFASFPFWFLPKSLPKQGEEKMESGATAEQSECVKEGCREATNARPLPLKLADIAKAFLPSLKKLLCTPAYFLLLCGSILKFNSFIGLVTFKPKYMEQQFGQSASKANFLIGVLNLPAVAIGIFIGGLLMKKYKLGVVAGAQLSFGTSFVSFLLLMTQFGIKCENSKVAGFTVSYTGTSQISYNEKTLLSACNSGCTCSLKQWDPVCADSGITYVSPCLAGCKETTGFGKETVFHNCSCVAFAPPPSGNISVILGQCPRKDDCRRSFIYYLAVSVIGSFISALGATPGYIVTIRCIKPELKSLAVGMQSLVTRTLGGIPAPVYFGALIDSTCLKWGSKKCGGRGACRMYNSDAYRLIYLGLISALSGSSYFFMIAVILLLRKQFKRVEKKTQDDADGHTEIEFTHVDEAELNHDMKLVDCLHEAGANPE